MSSVNAHSSFEVSARISIPLGIFIGLLASFIQSLGLTIQRKSHVINQSLPKDCQRVEHRRPLWLLGFLVFILSNLIGSVVQIASLPVVILAPLGAVSLLWNAFFARFILGDIFSVWMILGTILIAGGAVLIAVFGIVPEPTHSLEDLLELFRRSAFVVYFTLLGIAVLVCLILTHVGECTWSRKIVKAMEFDYASLPDETSCILSRSSSQNDTFNVAYDSTTTERTPLLDRKKDRSLSMSNKSYSFGVTTDRTPVLLAISYASISGIISGMCLIFAKSGVELLLLTIGGKNQFGRWESWILLFGLIVFALLQLWYLHKALILANPTLVCPSAFCFYNLSSIVNGLVYYNQLQLIRPLHLVLVAIGIVVLLSGVWVVSIQSGGGGVDVGTWSEEEEESAEESIDGDVSEIEIETADTLAGGISSGPAPTMVPAPDSSPKLSAILLRPERRIATDTCVDVVVPLSPESSTSESATRSVQPARQLSLHTATAIARYPSRGHGGISQRRSTLASESQLYSSHQRNIPLSSGPLSPPFNSTVSTLGAGLQIGLSPVSPGFIIIPRERRRRVSGLSSGGGDMESTLGRERRTVSEGDVRMSTTSLETDSQGHMPEAGANNVEGLGNTRRRGRKHWRWLKKFFIKDNP